VGADGGVDLSLQGFRELEQHFGRPAPADEGKVVDAQSGEDHQGGHQHPSQEKGDEGDDTRGPQRREKARADGEIRENTAKEKRAPMRSTSRLPLPPRAREARRKIRVVNAQD